MRKNNHVRSSVALAAILSLLFLGGCVIRPTRPIHRPQPQPIVAQPQPVVVQPRPVVVQPRPVVVQPRPVVVQQPAPVVVQQPAPVVVHQAPTVMTPIRISVPGSVAHGRIEFPHQRIRYPISISRHQSVNIYVQGHSFDPTVAVYDSLGRRIASNDDGGSGLDSQLNLPLAPGNYIIEVAGYSSRTGQYTLRVQ